MLVHKLIVLIILLSSSCASQEGSGLGELSPNPPPTALPSPVPTPEAILPVEELEPTALEPEDLAVAGEPEESETPDSKTIECSTKRGKFKLYKLAHKIKVLVLIKTIAGDCVNGDSFGITVDQENIWVRFGCHGVFSYD